MQLKAAVALTLNRIPIRSLVNGSQPVMSRSCRTCVFNIQVHQEHNNLSITVCVFVACFLRARV
jgi:hypothetical protein